MAKIFYFVAKLINLLLRDMRTHPRKAVNVICHSQDYVIWSPGVTSTIFRLADLVSIFAITFQT